MKNLGSSKAKAGPTQYLQGAPNEVADECMYTSYVSKEEEEELTTPFQ